ncbi:site-specific integrase [Paenibacillus brasilensis]|uniref:Integrase n=1 Tax=Paenibacillus brasilensis TaxID=128574 RepID=A0ABU0KUX0_9BACL|nr:site-specific integrase [Paenibacillus brasilensis]MDQ0491874.1 integrase [Paenibacillus brasilensis]
MASFKKHGTGWEYRLRYKDPFTQKFREKSGRGFKTKKEAELAAQEFERQLARGLEIADVPLIDYLNAWMDKYKEGSVRKNTIKLHWNNIKNHITPYFQKLMLRDLKPEMYQTFLNHLLNEKELSKRTVEIVHSTMHNALQKATTIGKVEKNPCIGVEIKGEKKKRAVKFIDSTHIPTFLRQAHKYGYVYWIFFKVLIETGMRKGEAAALKWSDIDLKNRTITIDETLDFQPESDEELFGDPKTFRSDRIITISQSLANDLRYHANWQNQNKISLGDGLYRHDLNLVLCRNDGSPMPKSSLFNAFERICPRAGLPKLPIHSLRHTYTVLALEAGMDVKFVQEQLGHGSSQITLDVYSHISKKLEAKNIDQFEEYTKGILGK